MPGRGAAKVTISLPQALLDFADQLAREQTTNRSAVIAELLEKEENARIQALMAEGYREMAEENRRTAQTWLPSTAEMLRAHSEWDDEPDA